MGIIKRYILNILISIDEVGSALTGGDPGETISSRLGKAHLGEYGKFWRSITYPLYVAVDFVAYHVFDQSDHCLKSIEPDRGSEAI